MTCKFGAIKNGRIIYTKENPVQVMKCLGKGKTLPCYKEREGKWRYCHKCLHPLAAGRECKFGQLGISKGFDIKRKTSPRWCPLK